MKQMKILGWVGFIFIVIGYSFLNSKHPNLYLWFNLISCIILLFHAKFITDYPLMGVNFFASLMLSLKIFSGGI